MSIADSARCGAKTKSRGGQCRSYHGGRSTRPKTEAGKLKCKQVNIIHGYYTKEAIAEQREVRDFIKACTVVTKD